MEGALMKKVTGYAVVAIAAAAIVFYQELEVLGRDDFRFVVHPSGVYKVFTYGFPFKVNDCNDVLDGLVHPSPLQTPYRKVGNFLFFFLLGVIGLRVVTGMRKQSRLDDAKRLAISP